MLKKKVLKKRITQSLLILFGAFLASIALNLFLEPYKIAPGGVSGLAIIIYHMTKGVIPVGILTLILNVPLIYAAYKKIGREFAVKSIIGTALYSLMIDITAIFTGKMQEFIFPHGSEESPIIFAVWGGIFLGLGLGMIFKGGASTGGTDIAARIFQKKMSYLTLGQLVLIFDALFLIVVAVTYESFIAAMYTGVAVFVSSKIIDIVEAGVNYAKEVYICTDKANEISYDVMEKLQRGITKLNGEGMYTGKSVCILWCVVYNRQLNDLMHIIDKHDPAAFMIVKEVRETRGMWS